MKLSNLQRFRAIRDLIASNRRLKNKLLHATVIFLLLFSVLEIPLTYDYKTVRVQAHPPRIYLMLIQDSPVKSYTVKKK